MSFRTLTLKPENLTSAFTKHKPLKLNFNDRESIPLSLENALYVFFNPVLTSLQQNINIHQMHSSPLDLRIHLFIHTLIQAITRTYITLEPQTLVGVAVRLRFYHARLLQCSPRIQGDSS